MKVVKNKMILGLCLSLLLCQVNGKPEEIKCKADSECISINPYNLCIQKKDSKDRICQHKPVFPMEPQEMIGSVVFALVMLMSNVGGIGGGGIAIPLVMVFFNFSMKPAIAISSFSIMCSTLARFFFNFSERNPDKRDSTSIDYGMTNVMMPLILIGSLIGAYVYVSFPDIVIQIILTILLFVLMLESGRKFRELYRKESEALIKEELEMKENVNKGDDKNQEEANKVNAVQPGDVQLDKDGKPIEGSNTRIGSAAVSQATTQKIEEKDELGLPIVSQQQDPERFAEIEKLKHMVEQERGHGQWKKQGINLVALFILLLNQILRGKVFSKCSPLDWVTVAIFGCCMIGCVTVSVKNVAAEQRLKKKYDNINLAPSDLIFEGKILRNVLCLGFTGGWVAGALGLGGGVIFNPLLLAMGVPPRVSSATGMYLITFSKIVTCVIYFIYGELVVDYALWAAFVSCLGSIVGLKVANWYMAKYGRQSIIVFCLTAILAVSVIGVPVFGARDLRRKADGGQDIYAFKSIC